MRHKVDEVVLKNGGRGLLVNVPGATTFSMRLDFRAGHDYVKSKEIFETPHVMEHLMFDAVKGYKSKREFDQVFTKNGAYRNAFTDNWSIGYFTVCADFEWERVFELTRLMVSSPSFLESDLASELGTVKTELTGYQNDYRWLLGVALDQAMGLDTPSLEEEVGSLGAIDIEAIREHYKRTHTMENMRFIISGDLDKKPNIVQEMERLGLGHGDKRFDIVKKDARGEERPVLVQRADAKNLTFRFKWEIPRAMTDEELVAVDVLDNILTETLTSRIFGVARDRGIVYGMGSWETRGIYETSWNIGGEVNYENAEELCGLIASELKSVLAGGISDEEVAAAKDYKLGGFQMRELTASNIPAHYANKYFAIGEISDIEAFPRMVKAVKEEEIIALAREFLSSDVKVFGGLGNVDQEYMDKLGKIIKEGMN